MPRKKRTTQQKEVQDYRHDTATRKNNPPAGIAAQGKIQETPKQEYAYNPHLPPNLRSDPNGDADKLPELLQIAQQRPLNAEEAKTLADALQHHSPWLEWAGKQETKSFTIDPVALHIHERVSAKAILKVAERQNVQRELFADPQQDYGKAVDFYQHDVDWANRLILGDSLTVMSSLAHREDLAGKVQMIYIDPPYGIKFASNFQPTVFQRDVKDREQDLTREREQIRAYRDTWTLGVHSYLAYLRDRLIAAKDLLTDSGSIFVQISDENIHRVRCIMDEVFGSENFVSQIGFVKTTGASTKTLSAVYDIILWYAKSKEQVKYRQVLQERSEKLKQQFGYFLHSDGRVSKFTGQENSDGVRVTLSDMFRQGATLSGTYKFEFDGGKFIPRLGTHWATNQEGLKRLELANRLFIKGKNIFYIRRIDDFPYSEISNFWQDTSLGGFTREHEKIYVVQTARLVIQRCVLMTTDPGDLILDPTCGSGTTAYVAESWGRRWITIDTSRVALALARQRLLTGNFDYYRLKDESKSVAGGFINKHAPHIMLKSIAQNTALDPIFAKHEPILKEKLNILNNTLTQITPPAKFMPNCFLNLLKKRDAKAKDLSQRQIVAVGNFLKRFGRSGKCRLTPIPIGPNLYKRL